MNWLMNIQDEFGIAFFTEGCAEKSGDIVDMHPTIIGR